MGAKILLYHCGAEKAKKLQSAVAMMGISIQMLQEEDLGKVLGFLAGLPDFPAEAEPWEAPVPEPEAMVMCGFSKVQFDLLMNLSKRGKLPKVGIKAMLTETNQHWTLGKLLGELWEEHQYLHGKKAKSEGIHRG